MEIIPAIDIIEGKCVRLTKGDYTTKKVYDENPLEVAKRFENAGIKRLHLVDLDGARIGKVINWKVLESISKNTSLQIDFGGGITSNQDVKTAFDLGAKLITVGSIAVKNKIELQNWIRIFGATNFLLGADVKDRKIVISGWTETTAIELDDFIMEWSLAGLQNIFCTDVSKDGMMNGPALSLYKDVINNHPEINLIASGGISCVADIHAIKSAGCSGVIIGKAFYEGAITFTDLKQFLD